MGAFGDRLKVGAAGDRLLHRNEHVEHRLLAGIRLAARLDGVDRRLQRLGHGLAIGRLRQALAERS